MRRLDLVGQVFGRLTVIKFDSIRGHNSYWQCRCSCSKKNVVTVCGQSLKKTVRGTQSCGCLMREYQTVTVPERNWKHGHSHRTRVSKEYKAWRGAKARCLNSKDPSYYSYGGRGIIICRAWQVSFKQFLSDMGECPKGYTLERLNVNGNYTPENCIWAPWSTQATNKRSTIRLTLQGESLSLSGLAKRFGVHKESLWRRFVQGDDPLIAAAELAKGIGRDGRLFQRSKQRV